MEKNFLKTGYVMVSRALLLNMFEKHGEADRTFLAYYQEYIYLNLIDDGMSSRKELPASSSITIIIDHIIVFQSCYHTENIAKLLDGGCYWAIFP